jgi:hypothetical protein
VRGAEQRVDRAEEAILRWIWTDQPPARKLGDVSQVHERDLDAIAAGVSAPREPTEPELSFGE